MSVWLPCPQVSSMPSSSSTDDFPTPLAARASGPCRAWRTVPSLKRERRKTSTTRLREQPTALGDVLLRRIGAQSRTGRRGGHMSTIAAARHGVTLTAGYKGLQQPFVLSLWQASASHFLLQIVIFQIDPITKNATGAPLSYLNNAR